MVPEAPLHETGAGLVPGGHGWFVLNARDARWRDWPGLGKGVGFESDRHDFDQIGFGLVVLEPGEPMSMYHWETDQEDFLVLAGEAIAIVEGQERPLRQWDLVHCPPRASHVIVGAGDGPCTIFAVGARMNHTYRKPDGHLEGREDGGAYSVSEAAIRHGAGVEKETPDAEAAYARFPGYTRTHYSAGWLPW
jgi:uncharacterized cupin superfamily protein